MIDNFSVYDIKNNYLSFLSSIFDSIRRITTFPKRHLVFLEVASLTKLSISTSHLTS